MNIIEVAYKWNGNLTKRESTDFIIVHHAEASHCTVQDIHQWHLERGFIGFGYNFFCAKDGTIYRGRPIDCSDADAYGYNNNSLSICFEGNFEIEYITEEQKESGIELIRYLISLYPKVKVLRHKDVNNTSCPGKNFDNTIITEGMQFDIYDFVAQKLGLNSPNHWREHNDIYVKTLFEKMANYIKGGK